MSLRALFRLHLKKQAVRLFERVYYVDGRVGGQAWTGELKSTDETLAALSNALTISILNLEKEPIYLFPAKGTTEGVQLLRETCGLGETW